MLSSISLIGFQDFAVIRLPCGGVVIEIDQRQELLLRDGSGSGLGLRGVSYGRILGRLDAESFCRCRETRCV